MIKNELHLDQIVTHLRETLLKDSAIQDIKNHLEEDHMNFRGRLNS